MLGPMRLEREASGVRVPEQRIDREGARVAVRGSASAGRQWIVLLFVLTAAMLGHSVLALGLPFSVYGYVYDEKGAAVSGASVIVRSPIDSQTSTSDSQGRYYVTMSINGVGDSIKVTASKGDARGEVSGTVPSGTSSLRMDVTILSPATTTSTAKTSTSPPTFGTTSTGATGTATVSSSSGLETSTASTAAASSTGRSNTTTSAVTTTVAYTTTETAYQVSYETSVFTLTKVDSKPQSLSTIVFSVEAGAGSGNASGIVLVSNVRVGDLAYDEVLNRITMSVGESDGSPVVFEIRVPKLLVADPKDVVLELDGRASGFKLASDSDVYSLGFWASPGQHLLGISLGPRAMQSNTRMMQAGSSAEGISPISSLLVGLTVLVILLSVGRRFS